MMQAEQRPLLGILGGMGPLATVDFLGKLTRLVPAACDQDHLPWVTLSQPGMPDRSRAIQNGDDGPRPYLVKGVTCLAEQGVKLIAIPCSTSHFWFDPMQAACPVPILHIADATVEELRRHDPQQLGRVAILATRGTVGAGIYSRRLLAAGFHLIALEDAAQTTVDRIIAAVKRGDLAAACCDMDELQTALAKCGVSLMILACTELPLAHRHAAGGLPAIDVSLALAGACLRRLGYLP